MSSLNPAPDHPGVIAPPPLVFLASIVVGVGLQALAPMTLGLSPEVRAVGWLLAAGGLGLAAWGATTMRRAGTNLDTREPATVIVQTGPYRYSRNPLYLSMTFVAAALGILLANPWIWITLGAALLVIRYGVVAREEQYLATKFGDGYLQYKARVRRWL